MKAKFEFTTVKMHETLAIFSPILLLVAARYWPMQSLIQALNERRRLDARLWKSEKTE